MTMQRSFAAAHTATITLVPSKPGGDSGSLHIAGAADIVLIHDVTEIYDLRDVADVGTHQGPQTLIIDRFANAFRANVKASAIIDGLVGNAKLLIPAAVIIPAQRLDIAQVKMIHANWLISGNQEKLRTKKDFPVRETLPGCTIRKPFAAEHAAGHLTLDDTNRIKGLVSLNAAFMATPNSAQAEAHHLAGFNSVTAVTFDNGDVAVLQDPLVNVFRKLQSGKRSFFFEPRFPEDFLVAEEQMLETLTKVETDGPAANIVS